LELLVIGIGLTMGETTFMKMSVMGLIYWDFGNLAHVIKSVQPAN